MSSNMCNLVDDSLPSGWTLISAGEFIKKKSASFNIAKEEQRVVELYSVPSHETGLPEILDSKEIGSNKQYVTEGDILLSKINPRLNRAWVVGNHSCHDKIASTEWIVFKKNEKIIPSFLKYALTTNRVKEYLAHNASGVGGSLTRVKPVIMNAIFLGVPSIDQQKRIVAKIEELFSELDNGIAALKTAREQLKVYRQAILKHAFEGKLTAQWRKENQDKLETPEQLLARIQQEREARYQQQLEEWQQAVKEWGDSGKEGKRPSKPKVTVSLNQFSDDELSKLPELPRGYIYTYLSNVGDLGRGKSKHRPRNDPKLFGGKYPFVQTAEVKAANRVINEFSQTYSDFGLAQSKLWPAGTLCITIAANIAETSFLGFDGCFPDSVVGFASYGAILPEYVELFIKAARVRIEAYAPATAQKNINLTTLENLVIPYCSINEQRRIIDELESVFSVIDSNENDIEIALKRAETLRQSILKKAFSGQLLPQDSGATNAELATVS